VFYWLFKLYARFAFCIYCRKIIINKPLFLEEEGPLLLAANHPNSFLDGIILTTLFKRNVYSLARGDAFKKPWINRFLRSIHLLPVYRTSEGVENLGHNYTTFASCQEVFERKGIVMIFSEGRCKNEWHLRPLKKGTARLALNAWEKGTPLRVIPIGFNYSSFRSFGKVVHINVGEVLNEQTILSHSSHGGQLLAFNHQLAAQLRTLVYDIEASDRKKLALTFCPEKNWLSKVLLALPGFVGMVLHAPLYRVVLRITDRIANNDHYDSVVIALLTLSYPLYWAMLTALAALWGSTPVTVAAFVLLPFTAWAYVQAK